ncbi:MAG: molybdopterin biosynthesis protein, partial [Thermicanus sp.]|nr:molybdopterin biosynthesis protein [Thermicanus sp.]
VANPLTRAAGVTMSLVRADGLLRIPPSHLGYEQGEEAEIELYRPVEEIERSILITGSHDLSLDLLQSHLRRRDPSRHLISSHVGSMGGILAIQKGEAHVAGIHLFDEKTGSYNIPFLEKYLKGKEAVLVHLAYRTQGWIVAKGNPHKINDVTDIVNKRLIYINRQRGAGTRLLFDDLLRKKGISRAEVYGYEQEALSHLSVAVAVKGGAADVGLGIYSAAKVMDLDFIPVAEEHYELLFLKEFYESEAGKLLIEMITSSDFRQELESLGGYDLRDAGKVVYVKKMA